MAESRSLRPRGWSAPAQPVPTPEYHTVPKRPLRRVLVAGDGRASVDGAMRLAGWLAKRRPVDVDIVIALDPARNGEARPGRHGSGGAPAAAAEAWQRELASRAAAAEGPAGAAWPIEVLWGRPAAAVVYAARDRGADLIVLAVAGRGDGRGDGIETALQLIRLADVPVLLAGPEIERPPRNALVVLNPRDSGADLVRSALEILDRPARLTVAVVPGAAGRPEAGPRAERPAGTPHRALARLLDEQRGREDVAIAEARLQGDPVSATVHAAARSGTDLLALPMPGSSLLERILLGRQTAEILRGVECTVLVSPAAGPAG